jgi:hypothetical protein
MVGDDTTRKDDVTIHQPEGQSFALDHQGGVSLYGDEHQPAMRHHVGGQVVHATTPEHPLVHMVCWDEDRRVELTGKVALVGDEHAPPMKVNIAHHFTDTLEHKHHVEPLDHALNVNTQIYRPIHHALQMRTPLQLRFCNAWHLASDYSLEIRLWDNRVLTVRLTGATIASPQPCPDDQECLPVQAKPGTT